MSSVLIADNFDTAWVEVQGSADTPCHEWTRGKMGSGYGALLANGKIVSAHRFAYAREYGEIPENMYVMHHCENPACVAIDHLFVVSGQEKAYMTLERSPRPLMFDENQVAEIRCRRGKGLTYKTLAEKFGTNIETIRQIVTEIHPYAAY